MSFKNFLSEERFHDYFDDIVKGKRKSAINFGKHGWFTVYLILETPKEIEEHHISPGKIISGIPEGDYKKVTDACTKISKTAQKAGMKKQRAFLLIKSHKNSGGQANRSTRLISIDKSELLYDADRILSVIAHEWAHATLFNLPKEVKKIFKDEVDKYKDDLQNKIDSEYNFKDIFELYKNYGRPNQTTISWLTDFISYNAASMIYNYIRKPSANSLLIDMSSSADKILQKIEVYSRKNNVDLFDSYIQVISNMMHNGDICYLDVDLNDTVDDFTLYTKESKAYQHVEKALRKEDNLHPSWMLLQNCKDFLQDKIEYAIKIAMGSTDYTGTIFYKNFNKLFHQNYRYYENIEDYESSEIFSDRNLHRICSLTYDTIIEKYNIFAFIDLNFIVTNNREDTEKHISSRLLSLAGSRLRTDNIELQKIIPESIMSKIKMFNNFLPNHGSEYIKKQKEDSPIISHMTIYAKKNGFPSGYSLTNEDELWAESVEALITGKPLNKKLKMLVINNL